MQDESEQSPPDTTSEATPAHDPDLARLIELVERIGGQEEPPL